MPRNNLAHTRIADKAIADLVSELMADGTASSEAEAIRIACATMDGAGEREGATVESMQTCRDLLGESVPGLTTEDGVEGRKDKFAQTKDTRAEKAEEGKDTAESWLRENDPGYRKSKSGWRA